MDTKNIKISVRIPQDLFRSLEKIKNYTKSQLVTRALDYWLEKKEDTIFKKPKSVNIPVTQFVRAKSDETRCLAAYGIDPYYRCGLERGHEGPHIFFCRDKNCTGFFFPHTPSNPHPCAYPIQEKRKQRNTDEIKCDDTNRKQDFRQNE